MTPCYPLLNWYPSLFWPTLRPWGPTSKRRVGEEEEGREVRVGGEKGISPPPPKIYLDRRRCPSATFGTVVEQSKNSNLI